METKQRIKQLIEENIDPILNSFNEWEKFKIINLLKYGKKNNILRIILLKIKSMKKQNYLNNIQI